MTEHDAAKNWQAASQLWSAFGAPLVPSAEDVAAVERAIAERTDTIGRAPQALLLGVTRQLAACRWPAGTRLVAIDNSGAMIDALWPAPGVPDGARVVCADWRAMPIATGSIDVAVGDGGYAAVPLPGDGRAMTQELHRVLRPGGLLAIRVYLRPPSPPDLAELRRSLAAGSIENIHALKWRIAAAIQVSLAEGVRLADIWTAWEETLKPAAQSLLGRPGWRAEEIATLVRYRGNATRYHFPTIEEFRATVAGVLDEVACVTKSYDGGALYPTFVLRRP